VWVLAGIAAALFGLLPRLVGAAWGAFAVFLVISLLGAGLGLDQWLLDVSPFTHIPKVPGADVSAQPLVWLLAIAVVLTAAGLAGFRRRDLG
jgi:ABC-2 type transport system permease protein